MAETSAFTGLEPYILTGVIVTDREQGHGAYGTVVELEYIGLKCAGKKIHEAFLEYKPNIVRQFVEELSQLRHPSIVQFLEIHFL